MDAYSDAIDALDRLIEWLRKVPTYDEVFGERHVVALREREYSSELFKRSNKVVAQINHLIEDGFGIPDSYEWRRLRESLESGCHFDHGSGEYDRDGQREHLRIAETARKNLEELHERKQKVEKKPTLPVSTKVHPITTAPVPVAGLGAPETVAARLPWWLFPLLPSFWLLRKGWFWKAIVCSAAAAAWAVVVTRLLGPLAFDEHGKRVIAAQFSVYAIAFAPIPTVFNSMLSLLNTIFKP